MVMTKDQRTIVNITRVLVFLSRQHFIVVHFNAGVCFKDHLDISSKIERRAEGSNP